ncbi:MAG: phosphoribosylformylglycinamidine synthase subunit PurS [Acidobacteria bacterium]|nr:phosphoribosylformylglycinamidine synthase subunit PurS [Acidobacteriota bacterium]MBI3657325.1 phosphoribosylformylglycinamidine synthase subunit PurS [Acidobacteriota bacterium]
MQARVYVTLKKGVLDPQGKTIQRAIENLGHQGLLDVRQGKLFEVEVDNALAREEAVRILNSVAQEILTNPVIETFRVEVE